MLAFVVIWDGAGGYANGGCWVICPPLLNGTEVVFRLFAAGALDWPGYHECPKVIFGFGVKVETFVFIWLYKIILENYPEIWVD